MYPYKYQNPRKSSRQRKGIAVFSFAGGSFIAPLLKIKQRPQHPSNKKMPVYFCLSKRKKKIGWGTKPQSKKASSWLMSGLFKRRGIRLRLCLQRQGGSWALLVMPGGADTEQAQGSLCRAGFGSRDCAEAEQGGSARVLGDPVLYLLFLPFVVLPYWLLPFPRVFFSILFLLKWLLHTGLSWSLSEIDVVPRTYPWVFKAMTWITKVSLC